MTNCEDVRGCVSICDCFLLFVFHILPILSYSPLKKILDSDTILEINTDAPTLENMIILLQPTC